MMKNKSIVYRTIALAMLITIFASVVEGCRPGGTPWPTVPPIQPLLDNPYQNYSYWYKGQTHTHTNMSDGSYELEDVVDMYDGAGYDFLAITDHNRASNWMDIGGTGVSIINGCESGDSWENHLIALNVRECPIECASNEWSTIVQPGLPYCGIGVLQDRVNSVLKYRGIAILAHPSSRSEVEIHTPLGDVEVATIEDGWTRDKMRDLQGYQAIEIVTGSGTSLDEWNYLLRIGRKVWGVAAEDFHEQKHIGHGWIVVNSNKSPLDRTDILENIKAGNFYAVRCSNWCIPSGHWPSFGKILVSGGTVSVYGQGARQVRFIDCSGILKTESVSGEFGVAYIPDEAAGFRFPERYIRIEIEDSNGNVAYSQPLFTTPETPCGKAGQGVICSSDAQCCGRRRNGLCYGNCIKPPQVCP